MAVMATLGSKKANGLSSDADGVESARTAANKVSGRMCRDLDRASRRVQPARRSRSRVRPSNSRISSSVVWSNRAYHIPTRNKWFRRAKTHHFVSLRFQQADRLTRADRDGDDDAGRLLFTCGPHRGAHGETGSEAIVDQDGRAAAQHRRRRTCAVTLFPPRQLCASPS